MYTMLYMLSFAEEPHRKAHVKTGRGVYEWAPDTHS